ncbi:Hypothetical protein, putative [Bodo saltans]|uniref:Transmembrane protein n=1 Tax=Bodo saltans TaxID=75058 RepID=A0A0S4JIF0_BODSA|nr:Hypothetical protein, putative [Bodo saltans]|eukprot:CUG89952.1 Hypothetical protein, putative [Bodo saltans]
MSISMSPLVNSPLAVIAAASSGSLSIGSQSSFVANGPTSINTVVHGVSAATSVQISVAAVSGAHQYILPSPVTLAVRALEGVTVSGLPLAMYVGMTATVTVTLTRAPQYTGTSLVVVPTFSGGSFSPLSVQFDYGTTTLVQQMTFTALTASCACEGVSVGLAGNAASIYAPVADLFLRTYPKAVASIAFPVSTVPGQTTSSTFLYISNTVVLTVSLGQPFIAPVASVVVQLSYPTPSAITMQTLVTFTPNTLSQSITITGVAANPSSSIALTVTQAQEAYDAGSSVTLAVLARIPLSLVFDPSTQPVIVGQSVTATVHVGAPSLLGDVFVSFVYGSEISFPSNILIARGSSTTSFPAVFTGSNISASKTLSMVVSGPGLASYSVSSTTWNVQVFRVRFTDVTDATDYIVVGNSGSATFELESLPALASDVVTVALTSTSNVAWASPSITLTQANMQVSVGFTALAPSNNSVSAIVSVTSAATGYAATLNNDKNVVIRNQGIISWNPPAFVYIGIAETCVVSINLSPPSSAPLVLTSAVTPDGSATISSSSSFDGSLSQSTVSILGVAGGASTLTLSPVTWSTLYNAPAPASVQVRPLETVSLTALPDHALPYQEITFALTVTRVPQYSGTSLTVQISTTAGTFNQTSFVFNYGDTTASVRGSTGLNIAVNVVTSGTAANIYSTPVAQTITIGPINALTVTTSQDDMCSLDNAIYVGQQVEMYVVRTGATTSEVTIALSYGTGSEITFNPSTVVLGVGVSMVSLTLV